MGYESTAPSRSEDPSVRRWTHVSCLRNVDGRNTERPQLDYYEYGWDGM